MRFADLLALVDVGEAHVAGAAGGGFELLVGTDIAPGDLGTHHARTTATADAEGEEEAHRQGTEEGMGEGHAVSYRKVRTILRAQQFK